jgi:predicted dehydrogenase
MVGHVLRYHPAVACLINACTSGAVGSMRRAHFRRYTSSATAQPLWALAPHDIATCHALDASPLSALDIDERGDAVHLELVLESGMSIAVDVSTRASEPMRRTTVSGSDGSIALDELSGALLLSRSDAAPRALDFTNGDALAFELDHFVACVRDRQTPRTSFDESVHIVQILERAQAALEARHELEPRAAAR